MTDERFHDLLRAMAAIDDADPPVDLWPRVAARLDHRVTWSLLDVGLAAAAAIALLLFPEWLWLLAYHL